MTKEEAIQLIDEIASSYYPCDKKDALEMAIKALEQESQTFEWCTDCREYDQEKHCCHRWSKVIRNTVEEMKQPCEDKIIEWKKDFKEYVNSLSMLNDDYKGIMEYIDELPVTSKQPCEDAISREDAMSMILCYGNEIKAEVMDDIKASMIKLPPVTPQESKTGHISIDDVMSVFDDFMCGEVDEDGTNTFLEMLKDKAESEET